MADQNPIQNNQAAASTNNANDLLGDISFEAPGVALNPIDSGVSDISDVLVNDSIDATQEKAENSMPDIPVSSMPQTSPTVSTDPTTIDLGEIVLGPSEPTPIVAQPENNVPAASAESLSPAPETTESPSGMFKVDTIPAAEAPVEIPAAPVNETAPAVETPATDLSNIALDTISIPAPEATPDVSANASPEISTPTENTPTSPADISIPAIEIPATDTITPTAPEMPSEPVVAVAPITDLPLPEEKSDAAIDNLMNNEQTQVNDIPVAPVSSEAQPATETAPANPSNESQDMSFDLDSLTGDISTPAMTPEATPVPSTDINATNNTTSVSPEAAPVAAAVASAVLPDANLVKPVAHGMAKKKAMMMAGAFIALLVVGGFVFKTMMPEEANKIFAGIMGTQGSESAVIIPDDAFNGGDAFGGNPNIDPMTGLPEESTPATTGEMNEENNTVDISTGTTEETPAEEITETSSAPKMTLDQAKMSLSIISQNSKRQLSAALKLEEKELADQLYSIFKESSNLLDALANTSDISTIVGVEDHISNLQKTLNQTTATLNAASNNAGS